MKRLQFAILTFLFCLFALPSRGQSLIGTGASYYSGNVNFVYSLDNNSTSMLYDPQRNIITLDGKNLLENGDGSYNYKYVDTYHSAYTSWNIPLIQTITLNAASDSWWRMESSDVMPEFFVVIKDAYGNQLFQSGYALNGGLPVTFPVLTETNVLATDDIYMEIWEYNPSGNVKCPQEFRLTANKAKEYRFVSDYVSGTVTVCNNPAIDVHWGLCTTYDYWLNTFGRRGVDNANRRLANFVNPSHYLPSLAAVRFPNNCCAVGKTGFFFYGMGDHEQYGPLVCVDVMAHEYTHAVINHNVGHELATSGEGGALNESFADIFACAVERYAYGETDWEMTTTAMLDGSCMRSLKNPKQKERNVRPCPTTYKGDLWDFTSTPNPHTNAGVQNYWFYLLVNGGSGTIDDKGIQEYNVEGIGFDAAMQIVYNTLIYYVTPNTTYADIRDISLQATRDLFGTNSKAEIAVANAWHAVGIGSRHLLSTYNITEGTYVIVANRQLTTDKQWYYLSSKELTLHGGTRLQAVETGVTDIRDINTSTVSNSCVWELKHTSKGWTLRNGSRFLSVSGDDAFMTDTASMFAIGSEGNKVIFAPAHDFSARLALTMQSSVDYYFFVLPDADNTYSQGMVDLYFLPYTGVHMKEEDALPQIQTDGQMPRKVMYNGQVCILVPDADGGFHYYNLQGQRVE